MSTSFNPGDIAYFVESKWRVREVKILKLSAGFATIHFLDGEGGIRISVNRLFPTKEAAETSIKKPVFNRYDGPIERETKK